jgi:asparagine synthase (glutamine-hydrolysing)
VEERITETIMCGIAGVLYFDANRPVDGDVLRAMGASIAHRGPDADGFLNERGVGLVHRRLSIIDLEGGRQPIGNEDGSIQVILNGEIYNFQELRAGLEERGHRFRTHSDTEVLVHLYEEHGPALVTRLRGMFAFALWDRPGGKLVLARDRLGIKPLYYYRDGEKLIFGSELKAILAHPGVRRVVNPAALEDYLAFGTIPGEHSIFKQIVRLPAAHVLLVSRDKWQAAPRRYWKLHFEPDARPTAQEWQERIAAKLAEAVRLHLIADVPVGAFLSGGVDSSLVVALGAGHRQDKLQTFSIGFQEEAFNELPYARQVAERFGTDHVEEIVTPDAAALLDELNRYYDEPFADSSAIPTYLVSRLASRHVKVVLSGDGGDEAFGGYARYAHDLKEATLRRWLPHWLRARVLGPLAAVWPHGDRLPRPLRAKTLLTNLSLDEAAAYANTLTICRRSVRRRLMAPDLSAELDGHVPEQVIRDGHANAGTGHPLDGMIAADVATRLPDHYLVKVDRVSMACGLEVRPPFLDHELLELAATIPAQLKIQGGQTKWILKQVCRQVLPQAVLDRPKHGFEIPLDAWLRGPLRGMFETAVLNPKARLAGLVDQGLVAQLHQEHLAGSGRNSRTLWSLLVLARWAEHYRA